MFRTHLRLAFRHLVQQGRFTLINTFGLALGIAVVILLIQLLRWELSFDQFHRQVLQIYRVNSVLTDAEEAGEVMAQVPNIVGTVAEEKVPGVEKAVRLWRINFGENASVRFADKQFSEPNFYWADPQLAAIFTIDWLKGDPQEALGSPDRIAISAAMAERYFGAADPIGEVLTVNNRFALEVRAVYADFPANSTLDADFLGSFSTVNWASNRLVWSNNSFETYLLLAESTTPQSVENALNQLHRSEVPEEERYYDLKLQPLADVYLGSNHITDQASSRIGDRQRVRMLGFLALLVLLIAIINYVNLSTAQAHRYTKEIGITKVLGGQRSQLLFRFYLETTLTVGIALIMAVVLLILSRPLLVTFIDPIDDLPGVWNFGTILLLVLFGILLVAVAGAYPAYYLSSFSPQQILTDRHRYNQSAGTVRRVLVVAQFAASTILVVGTLVQLQQLQFIQQKELGFQSAQVLHISVEAARNNREMEGFRNALIRMPEVQEVGLAQTYPGRNGSGRSWERPNEVNANRQIMTNHVDASTFDVLKLDFIAGGPFKTARTPGDTTVQLVINEQAARELGWSPEEAVGQTVECYYRRPTRISGVVENFHYQSIHQPIGAYAFDNHLEPMNFLMVRLATQDLTPSLAAIQDAFETHLPFAAFELRFLDDEFERMYQKDRQTASIIGCFSVLAILIGCLGLYGLASFVVTSRKKEISIRKVLGASTLQLVQLINREFLVILGIALLVGLPVAYYLINQWLQQFAYRIDLSMLAFVLPALFMLGVGLGTVSFQSIRAAVIHPAEQLRKE